MLAHGYRKGDGRFSLTQTRAEGTFIFFKPYLFTDTLVALFYTNTFIIIAKFNGFFLFLYNFKGETKIYFNYS